LVFESYFIRKGYVQLRLEDIRNLEARYAGRLLIAMTELDKIQEEESKRKAAAAKRR